MNNIKTAVLGCTGLVGQHFIRLLHDHPFFDLALVTASDRSSGRIYKDAVHWSIEGSIPGKAAYMVIQNTAADVVLKSGAQVVFSALPASAAGIEKELRGHGLAIFTNASLNRMDEDVPILIPEVNPEHIELAKIQRKNHKGFIIAGSNCSTSGLAIILKALVPFRIRMIAVSTCQSISGAGLRGLHAMSIMNNVIPHIKSEEEKIESESCKILGLMRNGKIEPYNCGLLVNCCRVPVNAGHLETLGIEFINEVSEKSIREALSQVYGVRRNGDLPTAPAQAVIISEDPERPQPLLDSFNGYPDRARGMAVTTGRIRIDGKHLRLVLLVNNLIRGAAGGCMLNAEFARAKGLI